MRSYLWPHLRLRSSVLAAAGVAAALSLTPRAAHAHNPIVHQDITDLAYEVMLTMEARPEAFIARHPGDASWAKFVDDVRQAPAALRQLPSDLPTPKSTTCVVGVDDENAIFLPSNWPHDKSAAGRTLGEIDYPVSFDYAKVDGCGLRKGWRPAGLFSTINGRRATPDYSGLALGYWAQHVDDELDDSHIWVKPTNSSANPISWVTGGSSAVISTSVAVLVAPFVCAWKWLHGGDHCWSAAKDVGHSVDPVENLEGLIPGVGDTNDGKYTGMWHHINMGNHLSNDYDDIEGFFLPDAGWGHPGAIDVLVMAGAGLAGLSINYGKSNGPKRYQITDSDDGNPDTYTRNRSQWQFHNIGLTAFEPLDNLAYFGWRNFKSDGHAKWLGWPLHAFGDAVVPMHTIGSPGWGHRPFEDSVSDQKTWSRVCYLGSWGTANTTDKSSPQVEQIMRIADRAYAWRTYVASWRASHGGSRDVPVRDMITELARQTHSYSADQMNATDNEWPFNDGLSVEYQFGTESAATAKYTDRDDMADRTRPLIENGAGAIFAFLASVTEVH